MPFHSHHHQQNAATNTPQGTASGIYQAAQALGSIGAPTGNLRLATQGTTSAGTDALLPGSGNAPGLNSHGGGQTAPPTTSGLPRPDMSTQPSVQQQQYDSLRRAGTIGARASEELHMSTGNTPMGQHGQAHSHQQQTPQSAQGQQHVYDSPQQYSAGGAPNINLQQATPQGAHYSGSQSAASGIPGSLQPGSSQRPGPASSYTAPTTVPTMPQGNAGAQQYTLPTRSNTMNTSHTYSRSSPAGLEQKYVPFSGASESAKYPSTPGQKYFSPTTPSGATSNSPLDLASIRPRGTSALDEAMGGSSALPDYDKQPTNSNYLAPWPVFAFDWCKWPVHTGNSAGKVAVGSYLEDAHNFVRQ
jgi:DDB1- and CUL4-associated factor 7